jgi:hypothetical protein
MRVIKSEIRIRISYPSCPEHPRRRVLEWQSHLLVAKQPREEKERRTLSWKM